MTGSAERPILFLDVDGPLIPFGQPTGLPKRAPWIDEANEAVAPRIGLPRLPVVRWPEALADDGPRGLHWKTRHLVAWAGRRSFIWVDDEISAMDRLWVSAQHDGQSLLHRVDPIKALTDDDFAELARWICTTTISNRA